MHVRVCRHVVCLFCFVTIKTNKIYLKRRKKKENRQAKDNTLRNHVKCNVLMSCVNFYCTHIYKQYVNIACTLGKKKYCAEWNDRTCLQFTFQQFPSPRGSCCLHLASFTREWRQLGCILKEIKSTFWSKRPRNVRETKTERTAMCTEEAK